MATPTTNGSIVKKPLLSLDTLTARDYLAIDGEPYDLLKPDQLTLTAFHKVQALVPRFDTLMSATTLDEEESDELSEILKLICRECVAAPPEVQARLTDDQRLRIVLAFAGLSQLLRMLSGAETATPQKATRSTGAKRSRASAASTRAPRQLTWLDETPMALVRAALAMLPRLDAEEGIATYMRVALGTGALDADASTSLRRLLNETAAPGHGKRLIVPATPADLKGIGIGTVRTPKKGPARG